MVARFDCSGCGCDRIEMGFGDLFLLRVGVEREREKEILGVFIVGFS